MCGGDKSTITALEAKAIAHDAAQNALDRHMQILPEAMKPMTYEVAEKVAARSYEAVCQLFAAVLKVDVKDPEKISETNKDFFFLREERLRKAADAAQLRNAVRMGGLRMAGLVTLTVIVTVFGIKLVGI